MAIIQPIQTPVLFAVRYGSDVFFSGIVEIGQACATAHELIQGADENTFLAAAAGKAGSYNPLPATGAWLKAGEIYGYNGGLVIVRQDHARTIYVPEDTPALFSVYRAGQTELLEWIANEAVVVGMQRTYGGKTYRCLQAHTTQSDWTPPATPALWAEVVDNTPGAWAVGVAYKINDQVTYSGQTYRCLQAHTSQAGWTPPAVPALWQKV